MTAAGDLLLPPIARVRNGSPHRHCSADRYARIRFRPPAVEEGSGDAACEARDRRQR
jgi:hypothetical protein